MQAIPDYNRDLARAGANVRGRWSRTLFMARKYPLGAAGLLIMIGFIVMALGAPLLMNHDPLLTNPSSSLLAPGAVHYMGTDFMGRDLFSRIVMGARTSITVGIGATLLAILFGVAVGLTSGFVGGKTDLVLQRLSDMLQALPGLILAMAMAAVLGPSVFNTMLAIAIPKTPGIARVIRVNALALRELPYVEAARAMGMSEWRIAIRHILPNTLAPLIVLGTAGLGTAILTEASLAFLGLGVPEPHPSWGKMLSESAAEYMRTAPWLVIFPGVAISLAVFGSNLLGDALRDIFDPRQRTTH